jgi:competence protein ComGC
MKAFGIISLFLTLCIIGYLMMKQTTATGPQGETVDRAKVMEDKARDAMNLAGAESLKSPISAFQTAKGRYPASLEELRDAGYIGQIPPNVDYDPSTGEVKHHD